MSEVRVLLITDVVGSTALAEQLGDARMAEVWAEHDELARSLLPPGDGREVDKSDGFLFLFQDPHAAATYAFDYHAALEQLSKRLQITIQARAGIHSGPVILRETPAHRVARGAKRLEVEGIAKPTTARVMSVAQGGQTLVTEDVVLALTDLSRWIVSSQGFWRLKGLSEPIELFELHARGAYVRSAPSDAPKAFRVAWQQDSWVPVADVPHRLPRERDAFVGRLADLSALGSLLDSRAPLVTVLGMGGTGKTRLVARYGWLTLGSWPGGVWFCDLSEARTIHGIARAVARTFQFALDQEDPVAQLGEAIAVRGRCLVILDNFEQVVRCAPETVGRWLELAPEAHFAVTSREVLGLRGEQRLALAPLEPTDAEALFVARARAAHRDFHLADSDRTVVAELVQLLDGLPLAIELAAARSAVASPSVLLARMGDRFRLLVDTGRDPRQATLQATLDWSWDLLEPWEKAALAQLSVFEGRFDLAAAEAVLDLSDAPWTMDVLQSLIDKSLVRPRRGDRFDLLVSVRAYAANRLQSPGPYDETGGRQERWAQDRHAAWYVGFADRLEDSPLTAESRLELLRALRPDLNNLLAAARRSIHHGRADFAAAGCRVAAKVLLQDGPFMAAVDLAEDVLAIPDLHHTHAGEAHRVAGWALLKWGDPTAAREHFQQAVALARDRMQPASELGAALHGLGAVESDLGDLERAQACYTESLEMACIAHAHLRQAHALAGLSRVHLDQGQLHPAEEALLAGLAAIEDIDAEQIRSKLLSTQGRLESVRGNLVAASEHLERALKIDREQGHRRGEGVVLGRLGVCLLAQDRPDQARAAYEGALAASTSVADRKNQGVVWTCLGLLELELGRQSDARAALDTALQLVQKGTVHEGIAVGALGLVEARDGQDELAEQLFTRSHALLSRIGDPVELALLETRQAEAARLRGAMDDADRFLSSARARVEGTGVGRLLF